MQKQRPARSPINCWLHINMLVGEEMSKCFPGPLVACVLPWAFLTFGWATPQARVPGLLFPHPPQPPLVPAQPGTSQLCLFVSPTHRPADSPHILAV